MNANTHDVGAGFSFFFACTWHKFDNTGLVFFLEQGQPCHLNAMHILEFNVRRVYNFKITFYCTLCHIFFWLFWQIRFQPGWCFRSNLLTMKNDIKFANYKSDLFHISQVIQLTMGSIVVGALDWIDFDFLSKLLILSFMGDVLRRDCWISLLIVGSISIVDAFEVVFLIKLREGDVEVLSQSCRRRSLVVRLLSFSNFFAIAPKMR